MLPCLDSGQPFGVAAQSPARSGWGVGSTPPCSVLSVLYPRMRSAMGLTSLLGL